MTLKKFPSLATLSWAIVIVLTLCNVLLIRQNYQLRAAVQDLESEQRVQVGDKLGPFRGADLEGKPVDIRFNEAGVRKVIMFSSTSCPFCQKQNPSWNQLIEQVDRRKYEVLELFREREAKSQVADYLKANGLSNEGTARVLFVGDDFLKAKKLNSTPVTLIVGENGIVERAWFGLWNNSAIAEVNSSLDISIQSN
jgi:peroxiredoxin